MPLITFLQKHGGMDFEQILSYPLIRLYTIQESLTAHVINDSQLAMGNSLLGGLTGATPSREQKPPQMLGDKPVNEMSRDEYFAAVNSQS